MLLEILLLLAVAAIIGTIGQILGGYSKGGCLISIVVGFIGAMIGKYLIPIFGIPDLYTLKVAGRDIPLFWSIIGAIIFIIILRLISPKIPR